MSAPTPGELELRPGDRAWVKLAGGGVVPAGAVVVGTVTRVSRKSATVALSSTIDVRAMFGRGIVGRA